MDGQMKHGIMGEKGTHALVSSRDRNRSTISAGNVQQFVPRPLKIKAMKMRDAFTVHTLEGTMPGKAGDYLVQGIDGELYPCAGDIFEKKYKAVKS